MRNPYELVTRRNFLRAAGVTGVGAVVVSCVRPDQCVEPQTPDGQAAQAQPSVEAGARGPEWQKPEFATFRSKDYPYEIEYPKEWFVNNLKVTTVAGLPQDFFEDPQIPASGGINTAVGVYAKSLIGNADRERLIAFVKEIEEDIAREARDEGSKITPKIERKSIKVGYEAHSGTLITTRIPQLGRKEGKDIVSAAFLADSRAWEIWFVNDSSETARKLPIFEEMVKTFKLTKEGLIEPGWVRHYSTSLPYTLYRPANWTVVGDIAKDTFLTKPLSSGIDLSRDPLINVYTTRLAQSLPLDAVWTQIAEPEINKAGGRLTSKKFETLGGQPSLHVAYDIAEADRRLVKEVVYAVRGNTLWQVGFFSPSSAAAKTSEIYGKMVASFQFTGK